jgi:hypothetical protein
VKAWEVVVNTSAKAPFESVNLMEVPSVVKADEVALDAESNSLFTLALAILPFESTLILERYGLIWACCSWIALIIGVMKAEVLSCRNPSTPGATALGRPLELLGQ